MVQKIETGGMSRTMMARFIVLAAFAPACCKDVRQSAHCASAAGGEAHAAASSTAAAHRSLAFNQTLSKSKPR